MAEKTTNETKPKGSAALTPSVIGPRGWGILGLVRGNGDYFFTFTVGGADWPAIRDKLALETHRWLGLKGVKFEKRGDVFTAGEPWVHGFSSVPVAVEGAMVIEGFKVEIGVGNHMLHYGSEPEHVELSPRWEKELQSMLERNK